MADPSPGLAATLVPVVVGGLIGLAGGWLGPWLLEGRKEANEKKRQRAEKFEELVAAIYEFDNWIERQMKVRVFGGGEVNEASTFAKIEAISSVYFPQFRKEVRELDRVASAYESWMFGAWQRRLRDGPEHANDGFDDAMAPYVAAREELLKQLNEFAHTEFQ